MLGAGERRFVLLDFLLIVLREVRTGSSDICGGGSQCTHGGVWGIRPNPSTSITSPHTGWRQLSEAASSALQRPPARPGHRFRSHRCGFPADTCSAPPSLLPPPSRHPAAAGSWHPATHGRLPCRALETQRCLGRERGALAGAGAQPVPRRPCRNASGSPSCSLLQASPIPHPQEGPWCGMERPAPVRSGQREPPHSPAGGLLEGELCPTQQRCAATAGRGIIVPGVTAGGDKALAAAGHGGTTEGVSAHLGVGRERGRERSVSGRVSGGTHPAGSHSRGPHPCGRGPGPHRTPSRAGGRGVPRDGAASPYRPINPFASFPSADRPRVERLLPAPPHPRPDTSSPRAPVPSQPLRKPLPLPPRLCPRRTVSLANPPANAAPAGHDPLRPSRPLSPPPPLPFVLRGKGAPASPPSPRTPPLPPRPARRRGEGGRRRSGDLFFIIIIIIAIYYYYQHWHILFISFYFIFIILGRPMMRAHAHSAAHRDLVPKNSALHVQRGQ